MSLLAMNTVLRHYRGTPSKKLLLLALANAVNDQGHGASCRMDDLADAANVCARQARRLLKDLEQEGLVQTSRAQKGAGLNTYRLHLEHDSLSEKRDPPQARYRESGMTPVSPPPDAHVTPPLTPMSPTGTPASPLQTPFPFPPITPLSHTPEHTESQELSLASSAPERASKPDTATGQSVRLPSNLKEVEQMMTTYLTSEPSAGGLLFSQHFARLIVSSEAEAFWGYWGPRWARAKPGQVFKPLDALRNWLKNRRDSRIERGMAWARDVRNGLSAPHPEAAWKTGQQAMDDGTAPWRHYGGGTGAVAPLTEQQLEARKKLAEYVQAVLDRRDVVTASRFVQAHKDAYEAHYGRPYRDPA